MTRYENCTMYRSGDFMGNYYRHLCKWVEIEIKPYAQYSAAVHVTYLEKGKRNPRGFVQTYEPSLVIAEGHKTPEPAGMFGKTVSQGNGVTVERSTYSSFDEGWENDFKRDVLPKVKVLADFHGHNPHGRLVAAQ